MASPLKIVILTCLLSLLVLLGEVKPALAKKGKQLGKRVKRLETSVTELKQKMEEQEEVMKEQDETIKELKEEIKEQDTRSKEQEERIKTLEECEACTKIKELNKTLHDLEEKIPEPEVSVSSCNELYADHKSSRMFTLMLGSEEIPVYCHMGDFGCGDGGWTLAMKIDGNQSTFHYDSDFWGDRNSYNLEGGKTGFDLQETKLPTYWNTPFSKICLGMKIGQQINFIVINKHADSLYSLIADGQYRATSLGRSTWKTLIGSQAYLQLNCNKEGFNAASDNTNMGKARIGFLANNENNCGTCDSRIGFGTGGLYDDSNTCGNEATDDWNGSAHIKAMGYILVQ